MPRRALKRRQSGQRRAWHGLTHQSDLVSACFVLEEALEEVGGGAEWAGDKGAAGGSKGVLVEGGGGVFMTHFYF